MMQSPELVVYLSVIAQGVVISILCGAKWATSQLDTFRRFPPAEYPQFYVFSLNTELIHVGIRALLDVAAILLVSWVFFFNFAAQFGFYNSWILCTGIQLVPSVYSVITLQVANRMRKQMIRTQRKRVSIVHRSVFDHLSLSYVVLLLIATVLTFNIIFSNPQMVLQKKLGLAGLFLITNLLLFRQIYQAIYGKPADRLIADSDKMDKRKQDVQRSFVGVAASVVIFSLLGISSTGSVNQAAWLIVPLSIFIQLAVFHRSKRWHADNMDVYK